MEYFNPINPKRLIALCKLTEDDMWQVRVLDCLIYRAQNSTLSLDGKACFTEPLQDLANFVGASSVRTLQSDLRSLEQHNLIERTTRLTAYGKQCFISLSDRTQAALLEQSIQEAEERQEKMSCANDTLPQEGEGEGGGEGACYAYQAMNLYRYTALLPLLGELKGRSRFMHLYVLNYFIWHIQSQAKRKRRAPDSVYYAISQAKLAQVLGLSERMLQRYLSSLASLGLLHKSRKRISAWKVETRYRLDIVLWEALVQANQAMKKAKAESAKSEVSETVLHDQHIDNKEPNPPKTRYSRHHEEYGESRHEEYGGCNIKELKKININKIHSTGIDVISGHVTRETCTHNGQSNVLLKKTETIQMCLDNDTMTMQPQNGEAVLPTIAPSPDALPAVATDSPVPAGQATRELPLDTVMTSDTRLNKRQLAYLAATLKNLETQHGCQFSDPSGLRHEMVFSLKAVNHVFTGKTTFCHRLNLIAKLLRERRWTTPKGYERHDAKGMAMKAKREAREAAWAAQKQTQETDQARLATVRGMGTVLAKVSLAAPVNPCTVPESVTERLNVMQQLAERAKAPDCSEAARAAIADLMREHQQIVQNEMATQRARHVQAAAQG